jgi:hypothetical protein
VDLKQFFTDPNHWVFTYGSPTPQCSVNSPYHRKQIEVLFEDKYDHYDVNNAVDKLISEGFLKLERTSSAHFVFRSDVRYFRRQIKQRVRIIEKYGNPVITKAIGDWAEKLFEYMFRLNGFEIIAKHTNKFKGSVWTKTIHDLDFIITRDEVLYGVEVKNTLPYIEKDEFDIKLEMCKFFGLIPLWILRNAPEIQFRKMKAEKGFIFKFKSQIYPLGQEPLVEEIWKKMRLPVAVWDEIGAKLVKIFLEFHNSNIR